MGRTRQERLSAQPRIRSFEVASAVFCGEQTCRQQGTGWLGSQLDVGGEAPLNTSGVALAAPDANATDRKTD